MVWEMCSLKMSRLTLRRMLESAVADSAKKLGLQKEVAETSRVNTDIAALLVDIIASAGKVALLAVGGGGGSLVSVKLLVGVVDEILLGRHVGCCGKGVRDGIELGWMMDG